MLLVIDVGNTNIVMGIYRERKLLFSWRVRTERNTTEDEFDFLVSGLFTGAGLRPREDIANTVISSVVPPMTAILDGFCRKYLNHAPLWVDARQAGVMPIHYDNPQEVGADRIVNAVAAYERFRCSLIVIDFGTATTFDAVSAGGAYLGGAISPGIHIAADALFMNASRLPRVEIFTPPERVIGKNTVASIQSGIIFGYAGLVDGLVNRMRKDLAPEVKVVATGGLAPLIYQVSETIDIVAPDLILEGLRLIHERAQ
ncbi:MAG: pantothenate kinase [Desulfococcus sp.]|nr:MAG: pantothenate kinase [Desulfococcus sp.]